MDFVQNNYYHIFNRGNNSQRIFFNRENYLFFLRKIEKQIQPFASVVSWCLMPTHFHLLVFIKHDKILIESTNNHKNEQNERYQTFNQSLGVLLSSYTKAIQYQENITGSLFQKRTKAKLIFDEIEIEPSYWNTTFGTLINIPRGMSYLETCVEYIHQNPVYSKLVKKAEDWEFSSYQDYLGLREGKLIDYGLLEKENLISGERILSRDSIKVDAHLPTKVRVMSNDQVETRYPTLSLEASSQENMTRYPNLSRKTSREGNTTHHPNRSREMSTVIIGIGSNINPDENIQKMLTILKQKVNVLKVSNMIKTKPIGIENQPDYTNVAVKIETELNLGDLTSMLKAIEDQMGRDRSAPKFGPRNIDLDIVVWNGEIVDEDYYTRDFLQKSVAELL